MTKQVDPLYQEAVKIISSQKTATMSGLQRGLKIGYNRAARIIEAMEEAGIVLPIDKKGVRRVSEWDEIDPKTPVKELINKAQASVKKSSSKKKASPKKKATPKKKSTKRTPAKKAVPKKAAPKKKVVKKKTAPRKPKASSKTDDYGLTIKDREFADLYRGGKDAVRGNAKRCYMAVHPRVKERTAETEGAKLLRKPEIDAYLKIKSEEIANACDVNAKWLLDRLIEEADADLADLYYDTGAMKPIHEWPMAWRRGLVSGVDVQQQFIYMDGERVPDGYIVKIKQPDRTKIKKMIGDHIDIQAFKENIEHSGNIGLADRMSRARSRNK